MRRFLRFYRFWLPLLLVLGVELAFRFGAWESQVRFDSHAGRTIMSKRVLAANHPETVDYITLGDSRSQLGLDHHRLLQLSREHGQRHIDLSMPGSHFLTLKVMTRYARDTLPNLRGILLVVYEGPLQSRGNGAYELAIVQPLRRYTRLEEVLQHVPFASGRLQTWGSFSALMAYREDVVDRLQFDPQRRAVGDVGPGDWWLEWTNEETRDLCAFPVQEADACARIMALPKTAATQQANFGSICNRRLPDEKTYLQTKDEVTAEWQDFLRDVSTEVPVVVVSLPQLSLFNQRMVVPQASIDSAAMFTELAAAGVIEWIDLREVVRQHDPRECSAFQDPWHLNRQGQQWVTQALSAKLEALWYSAQ